MKEFNSELRLDNSSNLVLEGDSTMKVFPNSFEDIEGVGLMFLYRKKEIKLIDIDDDEAVYFQLTEHQVDILISYLKSIRK